MRVACHSFYGPGSASVLLVVVLLILWRSTKIPSGLTDLLLSHKNSRRVKSRIFRITGCNSLRASCVHHLWTQQRHLSIARWLLGWSEQGWLPAVPAGRDPSAVFRESRQVAGTGGLRTGCCWLLWLAWIMELGSPSAQVAELELLGHLSNLSLRPHCFVARNSYLSGQADSMGHTPLS